MKNIALLKHIQVLSICFTYLYILLIKINWYKYSGIGNDCEDPYPSLSDYHDYEPNLEFDDTELQTTSNNGETFILL